MVLFRDAFWCVISATNKQIKVQNTAFTIQSRSNEKSQANVLTDDTVRKSAPTIDVYVHSICILVSHSDKERKQCDEEFDLQENAVRKSVSKFQVKRMGTIQILISGRATITIPKRVNHAYKYTHVHRLITPLCCFTVKKN